MNNLRFLAVLLFMPILAACGKSATIVDSDSKLDGDTAEVGAIEIESKANDMAQIKIKALEANVIAADPIRQTSKNETIMDNEKK